MFIIISVGPHHTKNIIQNALNLMLSFIIFKSCHVEISAVQWRISTREGPSLACWQSELSL